MSDVTAHLLTQLLWHQISVAFSWNRDEAGNIIILNEPVTEALARTVASLLRQQPNQELALQEFVARVRGLLDDPQGELGVAPEIRAMIARVLK
jgi:hypothetical protein